jgi:hypothetical protein
VQLALRRWRQARDLADVGDNSGKHFSPPSWPGLSRPSTSSLFIRRQDVDARDI